MFRNYLLIALRNLRKHRLYSFITVGGLAVGLAACLVIVLFVRDELSYDKWLPNAERIAKFESTFRIPGRDTPMLIGQTPGPFAPALAQDYGSDVEVVTRLLWRGALVSKDDNRFDEQIAYVESDFFKVFDLPVVTGNRERAVADHTSLLISATMAEKYFGDASPIGQVLNIDNRVDYTVVGVLEDLPKNTHLDLDFIALLNPTEYEDRPWVLKNWTSANVHTYALFRDDSARLRVEADLPSFVERHADLGIAGFDDIKVSDVMVFNTIPLLDIHLFARKDGYFKPGGDITTTLTISAIAVLILLIACINFVNLATARSMSRAREVAMRKVVGATRKQLVGQFLGESCLTALFGLVIAVAILELALGPFNGFLDKDLSLDVAADPSLLLIMFGLVVVVGLVGGLYPAFYLSQFRPARVLKANQSSATGSSFLRNGLVVFQFAVSTGLIVATAVVYAQTSYARNLDLGFERDSRLVLRAIDDLPETAQTQMTLKAEIEALPGVHRASLASDSPPFKSDNNDILFPTSTPGDVKYIFELIRIDDNFFETLGVEPVVGRLFSSERATDLRTIPEDESKQATQAIVISEMAAQKLGYERPEDALGEVYWGLAGFGSGRTVRSTIIGVVPDIHYRSVSHDVNPMMYEYHADDEEAYGDLIVDLRTEELGATQAAIEAIWKRLAPEVPMRTAWFEQALAEQYDAVERRGHMFGLFAILAVLIACLGLFGLAAFAAERRTKEIGVRKALGAGVLDIVRLLMWQFSKPVFFANLLAWPVAYWGMSRWLESFVYRIDLADPVVLVGIFGGASIAAMFIAWATVAGHATRVASANPVHALRFE